MMWGIGPPEVFVAERLGGDGHDVSQAGGLGKWLAGNKGSAGDHGQGMCPTSGVVTLIDLKQYKGFGIKHSMTPFVCPII